VHIWLAQLHHAFGAQEIMQPVASKLTMCRAAEWDHVDVSDRRVCYARNGDVRLAYRVFGESGPTLVWVPGWMLNNVDTVDEATSPYAALVEAITRRARLVIMDRRGTGLSDPTTHPPSLDERIEDLSAVLNSLGTERPTLVGSGDGGPICLLFAATYPDRVHSLIMWGSAARFSRELPDFPWGFTAEQVAAQLDDIDNNWGEGALAELFYGAAAEQPGVRELFGRLQRSIASPMLARFWWKALVEVDVRDVLASIRTPTLVLARPGDGLVPIESAKALAAGIPNARFVDAFPPGPHNGFDVIDSLVAATMEYVSAESDVPVDERVLKTVLFTDIVSSTELLGAGGDAHWRHQLDSHDKFVYATLSKFGGVRANHTGDGVFAVFDGPTRAARCALELVPTLATRGLRIRVGIHTGECERRGDDWTGLAVHTGARISALAGAGEVLASRTVRDLSAGSGLLFESLGPQHLKGLAEEVEVYRVTAP
jgi:class 3 adenylate cyclase/predicted alpha/beta hydrolase